MFKQTLMIIIAVSALAACSGKKGDAQKQSAASAVALYDSTKATELSGQDKFVKNISLKLKVGESYSYKFTKIDKQVDANGEMTAEESRFYTKKVNAIRSDGSMELTFVFDSIRVVQSAKGPTQSQSTAYNSNDSANRKDEKFIQFNSIINEEFTVIVDKAGDAIEILGYTPIISKILGAKKDTTRPEVISQIAQSIKGEVFQTLKEESAGYPETDLDNNQTWQTTDRMQLNAVLGVVANTDHKIGSVKSCSNAKFAEIDFTRTGQFILDPKAKGQVKFTKTTLSATGKCLTNLETGATVKKNSILTMCIEGESQGHQFSTTTTTETTVEMLK